jgi:hypothetical protein
MLSNVADTIAGKRSRCLKNETMQIPAEYGYGVMVAIQEKQLLELCSEKACMHFILFLLACTSPLVGEDKLRTVKGRREVSHHSRERT